ncbi:hypothetical protein SAMN05216359_12147 [Roseateles sp. YR242]|uniref:hypothetical protein n=1 Tax=Roseateles sp. YR242 TaxID=1855305 RepID=UPI0008C31026|nr:hypothetical protein [Roseateles sp. YR242]SEL88123.1 hypothetical protein SAMN05216359_12147 [Roseateles sp. YR242]
MHLLISHASAQEPHVEAALRELELPALSQLLGLLTATETLGDDDHAPLPPHELALARLRGVDDDALPVAAWRLRDAGVAPGDAAWALVTPIHLAVGADQVTALAPATLGLTEDESRAFLEALTPEVFPAAQGWATRWLAVDTWAVSHPSLDGQMAASLDRILNRAVETWMPTSRPLRTLLNELQMVLHDLPLNQARDTRGLRPVNAAWVSGCGRDRGHALPADLLVDTRLREPMLAGDLYAWSESWKALDAGLLSEALHHVRGGGALQLTLCGERAACRWERRPAGGWQRLKERFSAPQVQVAKALEAL